MKKISIISVIIIFIDQLVKFIIESFFSAGDSIEIIKNFFNITYTQNMGAAFSILNGKKIFLIIMAFIALYLVYKYLLQKKDYKNIEIITYSFLIAGICGNLIDRIVYGFVIDYLDFNIFEYNFPVFNIADILIVIGCLLLILTTIKEDFYGNKNN